MVEARLIVADYSSSGSSDVPNPCVIGSAHLYLGSLFVMSEGRRGVNAGRVESRLAVSEVLTRFRSGDTTDPRQRLGDALRHASKVLLSRSRAASVFSNSSATCSAFLIRGDRLYAARVGNVGLQLIRKNRTIVLFDHRRGNAPHASGLGTSDKIHPEVLPDPVPLQIGDRIVSGNDLLLNTVSEEECLRIVAELVPAVATRRLVEAVMRSGEQRPVSVQVVEVEDFVDERDELIPPMPSVGSTASAEPNKTRSKTNLRSPIPVGLSRNPRWLPKLLLALVALLVLGMGLRMLKPGWFSGDELAEQPTPKVLNLDEMSKKKETPAETLENKIENHPVSFWRGISRYNVDGELQIDQERLRDLLVDSTDLQRRLREAQLITKELEGLIQAEAAEASKQPSTSDAMDENPGDASVSVEEELDWDPSQLPKNLRGFDVMFAHEDPKEAASRLRRYIGARHKVAERVFLVLDAYLDRAPKARSLRVLKQLEHVRPKPGPKTRRWAWKKKRKLRRLLHKEESSRFVDERNDEEVRDPLLD